MPRNILEIGAELMPIMRRHGIHIGDDPPEEVIENALTELTERSATYRSDLKILKSLLADMNEINGTANTPIDDTTFNTPGDNP